MHSKGDCIPAALVVSCDHIRPPFEKETVEKAALRAIKHLFPSTVLALLSETLYCVQPRTRDFELNLKSGGSILWWLGVKRVASIAFEAVIPRERRGKFRLNPKPSIGMDRYRFTGFLASVSTRDAAVQTVQFRFPFPMRLIGQRYGWDRSQSRVSYRFKIPLFREINESSRTS